MNQSLVGSMSCGNRVMPSMLAFFVAGRGACLNQRLVGSMACGKRVMPSMLAFLVAERGACLNQSLVGSMQMSLYPLWGQRGRVRNKKYTMSRRHLGAMS